MVMGTSNEDAVLHAMGVDDAYRVERVLARSAGCLTELVRLEGAGPFVRKKIPLPQARRGVWAALSTCTCPYLPKVRATYEMPDHFVVVCDYVPGQTLSEHVAARGRLSAEEACSLMGTVVKAICALHAKRVVHCDLAPSNVVVAEDGAHVIDLGIARMFDESVPRKQAFQGTVGFAAPEQYGFADADTRSDVYSLGCLLGYMLTGMRPSDEPYEGALRNESVVARPFRLVVERACAFEPSARYQSAEAFSEALAAALAGGKSEARRVPMQPPAAVSSRPKASKKRKVLLILGLVAACAVVVALQAFGVSRLVGFVVDSHDQGTQAVEGSAGTPPEPSAPQDFASDADETVSTDEVELEVVESGWSVQNGYVKYGIGIANRSEDVMVEYPTIVITGRDEDGSVLFSDEQVLGFIMPQQTLYWGGQAGNGTLPETVEFSLAQPHNWALSTTGERAVKYSFADVRAVGDGFGGVNFTGEVQQSKDGYKSDCSSQIAISVVLRDSAGKIVYGTSGFSHMPLSGEELPFEVAGGKVPAYESIEAYAVPWA